MTQLGHIYSVAGQLQTIHWLARFPPPSGKLGPTGMKDLTCKSWNKYEHFLLRQILMKMLSFFCKHSINTEGGCFPPPSDACFTNQQFLLFDDCRHFEYNQLSNINGSTSLPQNVTLWFASVLALLHYVYTCTMLIYPSMRIFICQKYCHFALDSSKRCDL